MERFSSGRQEAAQRTFGAWRGSPRGFLHADGSSKPAFFHLDNLINKAWRTNGEWTTGEDGAITIPGAFVRRQDFRLVSANSTPQHEDACASTWALCIGAARRPQVLAEVYKSKVLGEYEIVSGEA